MASSFIYRANDVNLSMSTPITDGNCSTEPLSTSFPLSLICLLPQICATESATLGQVKGMWPWYVHLTVCREEIGLKGSIVHSHVVSNKQLGKGSFSKKRDIAFKNV